MDNSVNLRIRVHIIHGDLSFVDFSDCEDAKCGRIAEEVFSELHCKFEEAIVTVQSKLSNTNANSSDSVKTSISVTSMELFEQNHSESSAFLQGESNYDEYRRILLSFYAPISHRSIIAAPAIDISIDQVTAACKNNLSSSGLHLSSINVSVLLQPAILSVYISQINKWAKVMSSLVSNVASQESTSNCNLSINCASVDVILHSDHKVPRQCWDDISFGCVLAGPNSDWRIVGKTQQSEAPLLSHLVDSYGGLLFTLENLNVVLQTFAYKSQPSVQTIEMDKLQASLLLSTEELPQLSLFNPTLEHKVRTYYTALIMVASSDPSQKVTISKESLSQIGTNEEDETDHSPDLGPIPPSVGRGSIIKLRAYLIDVDIKQTEYNAVIHLSETMDAQSSKLVAKYKASQTDSTSDPSPAANVENASSQQAKSSSNGIKFGLSFNSAYSKITIRENCKEDYVRDESSLDEDSASSDSTSSNLIDVPLESSAVCFTVSIREPTIEVLSVPEEVFVTLRANDLSMYDMTCEEYIELLDSHFNFLQSSSGQISRSGSNKHKLPFVRRAALHDNKQKYNDNMVYCYPTLLGNNSLFKSAFELRLQLTSSREATQSVHFFIDLYDIILSHEPSSIWILNLVALLTPLSVKQLVIRRKAVEFQDFTLCNDTAKEVCSPVAICVNQNGKEEKDAAFKSPFEITKVNVRIRDCVIDYCCPRINSRALFSIGLLTLSSTIVSNSKRFSLKFKALNFALYISNQILNDTENMDIDSEHTIAKKQSSHKSNQEVNFSTYKNLEEFLQQFSFVQLLSIDQLDNNVFFHKTTLEDLALQIGVGMCTISGCIDSLNLFVVSTVKWL